MEEGRTGGIKEGRNEGGGKKRRNGARWRERGREWEKEGKVGEEGIKYREREKEVGKYDKNRDNCLMQPLIILVALRSQCNNALSTTNCFLFLI